MTGGVLNPPVFLYSADYEALTENHHTISQAGQKTTRANFIHEMCVLVEKLVLNVRFVHRNAVLVDKRIK